MRTIISIIGLSLGLAAYAQDYTDIVKLLHADLHHEKHAILMANLKLTPAQDSLFEPVYAEYSATFEPYWAKRLVLVDDLAHKQDSMTNNVALSFMERLSDLEKENIDIRDEYAEKMEEVLPATVVARWVQMERRLVKLMELQVANEIPLMPTKP